MSSVLLLAPFVLLGVAVLYLAFSSGPGGRRRRRAGAVRSGPGPALRASLPVVFIGLGLVVPAAVIAAREASVGGTGELVGVKPSEELTEGKRLFGQNCASCHSLAAFRARGATGPNLDELGRLSKERVLNAIKNGGTGDLRMPAGLLEGQEAEAVAAYVSRTAGR